MRMTTINWELEYQKDIASGNGFDIYDTVGIDTKTKQRTEGGIFSTHFGGDEVESATELYTCECKSLKGKFYLGMVCEECGTEVKYHNNDVEKTGWISLTDYKIINPIFFNIIVKAIGLKNLVNIIKYTKEIDQNGQIITDMDDYDENNPYCNLGMVEFEKRFDEVMNYFRPLRKDKQKYFDFLDKNKEKVFSRRIPVFSLILRPIMIIQNNVIYADINRKYALLLSYVDALNKNNTAIDTKLIKVLPSLYETQLVINEIHNMIIGMVGGKKGHIRSSLMGTRINYSSRCVIIPLVGRYRTNELIIPYLCFLELYKFEIINLLSKIDGISISEANEKWQNATRRFDKRVYSIMKYMIKNTKGGLNAILNRNPTISYGSMLAMKIADVKSDIDDLTMCVPVGVLSLLAGDSNSGSL